MKKILQKGSALVAGVFASTGAFALDTTGVLTAVTGAGTDLETVAVAIIGVAAVMFGISKIRQVIKA
jgi:uncharacterized membrane protein YuzA (DUF378 family)